MLVILAIVGIVSILLAQLRVAAHPVSTFYLIPTRLWEILIGSFVAIYFFYKDKEIKTTKGLSPAVNQIISALGLSLVLLSIFIFDETTPFPSFYTLTPTLGTALIIVFASGKTITGKLLSNKLLVGIGLISYSAYLWHQPIFAFARIISIEEPTNLLMLALALVSLTLAYITWKYVETPFRNKTKFNRKMIFQFAAISSAISVIIGALGYFNKGFGNRVSPNKMSYARLDSITQPNLGLNEVCNSPSSITLEQCRTDDHPEILVWGDSFAMHLVPGILASKPDVKIIQVTNSNCVPIIGMAPTNSRYPRPRAESCIKTNDEVIAWLGDNPSVHYVILGSAFSQYIGPNKFNTLINDEILPSDTTTVLFHFKETLAKLSKMGIKPIVFAPPPENGTDIGRCLVYNVFYVGRIDCRIEVNIYKSHEREILEFLKVIEKDYPVIWVSDVICDDTYCNPEIDGVFIYGDGGHLSIEGSEYLGKRMDFYSIITSK